MDTILGRLQQDFPQLTYIAGNAFCWSPANQQITYKTAIDDVQAVFSLLHETGHALLEHKRYKLDFELLQLEVAAWERAQSLATDYDITIDEDHIQDCLDTYRDWLYGRSICPSCTTKALQVDNLPEYRCHNCQTSWKVTTSRFCRPYRQNKKPTFALRVN